MFIKDIFGRIFNLSLAELISITISDYDNTAYVKAYYKNRLGIDAEITLFKSKNSQEAEDYLNWIYRQIGIGNPI